MLRKSLARASGNSNDPQSYRVLIAERGVAAAGHSRLCRRGHSESLCAA